MSGGRWNYQSWKIQEEIEDLSLSIDKFRKFTKAIAESEHLIDWAESGDTSRRRADGSGAEKDLYDLWLKTFDEVFGDHGDGG